MTGPPPPPPRPRPDGTTFPDAEVTAAIEALRSQARRLDAACDARASSAVRALADWQGGFRDTFTRDLAAGQHAAHTLAGQLRAAADALERAAETAARLRRQRAEAYQQRLVVWAASSCDGG